MTDSKKVIDAIAKKKLADIGVDINTSSAGSEKDDKIKEESIKTKNKSANAEGIDTNLKDQKSNENNIDESIEILTTASVARLVEAAKTDSKIIELPFEDLVSEFNLVLRKKDYKFDKSVKLTPPKVDGDNKGKYVFSMKESKDKENCQSIIMALPGLTPAQATDENLWVTLVFNQFNDYVRQRWKNPKKPESIRKHWFASNWRQRTSDNAIARLWWVEYLAQKADPTSSKGLKDILLSTAEYRTTLLERPTSSRSTVVLQSILEVTKEAIKKKGMDLKRDSFRDIMKEVGFVGKRRLLHALPKPNLKKALTPIFQKGFK